MTTTDRALELALLWMNPSTESPRVLEEVKAILDVLVEARDRIKDFHAVNVDRGFREWNHRYLEPLIDKIDAIVEGK